MAKVEKIPYRQKRMLMPVERSNLLALRLFCRHRKIPYTNCGPTTLRIRGIHYVFLPDGYVQVSTPTHMKVAQIQIPFFDPATTIKKAETYMGRVYNTKQGQYWWQKAEYANKSTTFRIR